jgi:hypothetical protein
MIGPVSGCGRTPRILNRTRISRFHPDFNKFFIKISMLPENAREPANQAVVWKDCLKDEAWRIFLRGLLYQVEEGSKDTLPEPFFIT